MQTDRESRWFGTPYAVQKLDAGELARQAGAADGGLRAAGAERVHSRARGAEVAAGQVRAAGAAGRRARLSAVAPAGQLPTRCPRPRSTCSCSRGGERQCARRGPRGAAGAAGHRRAQRVRLPGEPRGTAVQRRVGRARTHGEDCRLRRQAARAARQGAADPAAGPLRGRSLRGHQDRDAARLGQQRQAAPLPAAGRRDAREPGGCAATATRSCARRWSPRVPTSWSASCAISSPGARWRSWCTATSAPTRRAGSRASRTRRSAPSRRMHCRRSRSCNSTPVRWCAASASIIRTRRC